MSIKEKQLEVFVKEKLNDFYTRRLEKLSSLELRKVLKRKNPYLFRAIGVEKASEFVELILQAYMSSSEETMFGDAFFEPLLKKVTNGIVAGAPGVDVAIETDCVYKAIAVKSGPSVFNAQSRKKQKDQFSELRSRLLKLQKQFDAVVGYCYGKLNKKTGGDFRELAGQELWAEITGDEQFYLKIIHAMKDVPIKHKVKYNKEWGKAVNRFSRDFLAEFSRTDGSIDWDKLVVFNSGK